MTVQDLNHFLNVTTVLPTYHLVTNGIPGVMEGTHQFIRDIQLADLLQTKFHNMTAYQSAEGFQQWLAERAAAGDRSLVNAVNRLQGHAGEVDFLRDVQGRLQSVWTKVEHATNSTGQVTNNVASIDFVQKNRFTGEIIRQFQVKAPRSAANLGQIVEEFRQTADKDTVLVGPKELIEEAKRRGLPNPTKVVGTIQDNARSAQEVQEKIEQGKMATQLTPGAAFAKVVGGAAVGAVVAITVSGLVSYLDYKAGRLSREEMYLRIGKDGAKGAITGGAMTGLSLFIPGGLIGFGVGFVAGTLLRRVLDEAFGDGVYAGVLANMKAVHANVQSLHDGAVYICALTDANEILLARAGTLVDDFRTDRFEAGQILDQLDDQLIQRGAPLIEHGLDRSLDRLDRFRNRLGGNDR